MNKSPLFISFEGGEGAGKSSLIERLDATLKSDGYQTVLAREPGGTPLGEQIRALLLRSHLNLVPMAECLLFLASRQQQIEEVIKPSLEEGKIVLCDRFHDSTIAYQGVARQLGFEKIQSLCLLATDSLEPSLTFYLDIDPLIGIKRAKNTQVGDPDRLEKETLSFHQAVREGFLHLSHLYPERIQLIDASQSKESVFLQVYGILCEKLQNAKCFPK